MNITRHKNILNHLSVIQKDLNFFYDLKIELAFVKNRKQQFDSLFVKLKDAKIKEAVNETMDIKDTFKSKKDYLEDYKIIIKKIPKVKNSFNKKEFKQILIYFKKLFNTFKDKGVI